MMTRFIFTGETLPFQQRSVGNRESICIWWDDWMPLIFLHIFNKSTFVLPTFQSLFEPPPIHQHIHLYLRLFFRSWLNYFQPSLFPVMLLIHYYESHHLLVTWYQVYKLNSWEPTYNEMVRLYQPAQGNQHSLPGWVLTFVCSCGNSIMVHSILERFYKHVFLNRLCTVSLC